MLSRRADRWGFWCGGLLLAAGLAPATPTQEPAAIDATVHAKADAKIKAAEEVLAMCREFLIAPPGERATPPPFEVAEQIQLWSRNLTDARLEATNDRAERIKILTEASERAKGFEVEIKDLAGNEASGLTKLTAHKAIYYRADAEAQLAREQAKPPG